jgi:aryl-alcohol dehydrogenase-like predicted oxidoreductase
LRQVHLGRTNQLVSELCLGTMFFGTTVPTSTSEQLLDRFLDAGGNFLDTANNYCTWIKPGVGGESETLLGEWMKSRHTRNRVFIATKLGFPVTDGNGLSAAQIVQQAENSLRRLQTETIDLYYAHHDDRTVPLEETLEAFNRLVQAGKVRFIAASNYRPWRLEKALLTSRMNGWAEYQAIQQRHTYLRPLPNAKLGGGNHVVLDNDLNDLCRDEKITILAFSILLAGAYTRSDRRSALEDYMTPESEPRLARLNQMAVELGISPNTLILAWLLHSNPQVLPVIGASSIEQLEENLAASDVSLGVDHMIVLNDGLPS